MEEVGNPVDNHYFIDKIKLGDLDIVCQDDSASHRAEISRIRIAHMGVESLPSSNSDEQTLNTHI